MRKLLSAAMLSCLIPATLAAAQIQTGYAGINQGDWAVAVVRSLGLDVNRELVRLEDFTTLLEQAGIAPAGGWLAEEKLPYADFIGTLSQALLYINSEGRGRKEVSFIRFISFLETRVGLSAARLLAGLPKTENMKNLSEELSSYLADQQKVNDLASNNQRAGLGSPDEENRLKSKTGAGSFAELASVAIITSLADALYILQNEGPPTPSVNYWNVFSKPASPILPYQF